MKNKLILIGGVGGYQAFLNIDLEEAIQRVLRIASSDSEESIKNSMDIQTLEFDDQFWVYDAWED